MPEVVNLRQFSLILNNQRLIKSETKSKRKSNLPNKAEIEKRYTKIQTIAKNPKSIKNVTDIYYSPTKQIRYNQLTFGNVKEIYLSV